MLDVGDFEVLDECAGEDDNEEDCDVQSFCGTYVEEEDEEEDYEHENPKRRASQMNDSHVDDNSGDNTDNILDVSIDVAENEFLENVAKDFSENIEDVVEEQTPKSRYNLRRGEPTVQIKKLPEKKVTDSKSEAPTPKKKPGPKCKTMNVQSTPAKKPIQKISFTNDNEKKEEKKTAQQTENKKEADKNESEIPKAAANSIPQQSKEKSQQNLQRKTPAFLKKDLTDEEIMIHFDEIENTVLTSDSFVIEHEIDQSMQEADNNKSENNGDKKDDEKQNEDKKDEEIKDENKEEEENWDETCDKNIKNKPEIKIEEKEFKESEMWYKEKQDNFFISLIIFVKVKSDEFCVTCLGNKKNIQQTSKDEETQADNTSDNKNAQSSWQMIPGVADANMDNTEEYPPFVMRVVKFLMSKKQRDVVQDFGECKCKITVFEEFLKSLEESTCAETEEIENEQKETHNEDNKTASEDKEETTDKPEADQKSAEENNKSFIENLNGLTVLLRCNRKEELMMHITGKNISAELMDKFKDLFENGAGKDCNVKSLYCKTIIKDNDGVRTNNTFLFGSETLDDSIGNVKIQLAPKANVWANLAGVEVLADVVTSYLVPTQKTTVIEIGCGTGLISLLIASKCQKVIGVDVQKEIAEAEILSELNGIKNATFLTGKPKLVMSQIDKSIATSKAVAVINTNNAFGRSIEVISSLRQMSTLGRIVIITTLTKQAIRSILELTQPADEIYGNPFIPIKACIVDTTPKSFGFEIVMSMERRTMRNLLKVSPVEGANTTPVGLISKSKQAAGFKYNSAGNITLPAHKKGLPSKFVKSALGKPGSYVPGKKFFLNPNYNPVNKFQGKRPYPGSDGATFHPGAKKFKQFDKPYPGPNLRLNPMHDKKIRDDGDLREKLSSGRVESTAMAQEMQEQKKILDAAKEKLTGAGSSVDVETVKKLQEMLNLAIEKTNKLQSQLPPRSVWDRIAPPDSGLDEDQMKSNPPMRGRLVKETGPKKIIITTSNDRDGPMPPPGKSKKYDNLPPLEPNLIMPVNNKPDRLKMSQSISQKPSTAPYQKPGPNRFKGGNYRKQDNQSQAPWNRHKAGPGTIESQERWSRVSPPRRSPPRQIPPPRQAVRSPPRQSMRSPPRQLLRSPPRQSSPARRPVSPVRRPVSPPRRPISPPRRPVSPVFRQHSSSSRGVPSGGRSGSPSRRHNSPPRRPVSPHNYRGSPPRPSVSSSRQKSPPARRYADEWDIPSRSTAESGWPRAEKEKTGWQAPTSSSSTNWNQSSSNSGKYRSENDKWDNRSGPGTWNNKNAPSSSQNNSGGRWKDSSGNTLSGTNWDVKKDSGMRDMGRHESRHEPRQEPRMEPRHEPRMEPRHELRMESRPEPRIEPRHEPRMEPRMEPRHEPRIESRHEPRHESRIEMRHEPRMESRHEPRHELRHEPRWEPPEKSFRNEKDDWGDLPEDARDPWGDNDPPPPSNETRWGQQNQSSTLSNWSAKPNFPMSTMSTGAGNIGNNVNPNIPNANLNMNMGMGMNNPNKGVWQNAPQQPQQPNRNQNWLPPGNWQGAAVNPGNAGGQGVGMGGMMIGNTLANWQPSQQSFANFSARPFNNNPFMNNRR
ncbi:hypothetical protein TSAR_004722 [Trichomalopsis sarcophagae]|uniref:Methyltransferase domain-containing protein n=1 Tax=Trichomalopsis sarcophagae TaxID=543379 RepID=A0A232FL23_9HYME|nr:hypothetical protein TSAR_004722 [Trichomalopsis sarcophagae]